MLNTEAPGMDAVSLPLSFPPASYPALLDPPDHQNTKERGKLTTHGALPEKSPLEKDAILKMLNKTNNAKPVFSESEIGTKVWLQGTFPLTSGMPDLLLPGSVLCPHRQRWCLCSTSVHWGRLWSHRSKPPCLLLGPLSVPTWGSVHAVSEAQRHLPEVQSCWTSPVSTWPRP